MFAPPKKHGGAPEGTGGGWRVDGGVCIRSTKCRECKGALRKGDVEIVRIGPSGARFHFHPKCFRGNGDIRSQYDAGHPSSNPNSAFANPPEGKHVVSKASLQWLRISGQQAPRTDHREWSMPKRVGVPTEPVKGEEEEPGDEDDSASVRVSVSTSVGVPRVGSVIGNEAACVVQEKKDEPVQEQIQAVLSDAKHDEDAGHWLHGVPSVSDIRDKIRGQYGQRMSDSMEQLTALQWPERNGRGDSERQEEIVRSDAQWSQLSQELLADIRSLHTDSGYAKMSRDVLADIRSLHSGSEYARLSTQLLADIRGISSPSPSTGRAGEQAEVIAAGTFAGVTGGMRKSVVVREHAQSHVDDVDSFLAHHDSKDGVLDALVSHLQGMQQKMSSDEGREAVEVPVPASGSASASGLPEPKPSPSTPARAKPKPKVAFVPPVAEPMPTNPWDVLDSGYAAHGVAVGLFPQGTSSFDHKYPFSFQTPSQAPTVSHTPAAATATATRETSTQDLRMCEACFKRPPAVYCAECDMRLCRGDNTGAAPTDCDSNQHRLYASHSRLLLPGIHLPVKVVAVSTSTHETSSRARVATGLYRHPDTEPGPCSVEEQAAIKTALSHPLLPVVLDQPLPSSNKTMQALTDHLDVCLDRLNQRIQRIKTLNTVTPVI